MRRRFTLAIVGAVVTALLVAGLGTFVLLTLQSRREARREVVELASRVAAELSAPAPTPQSPNQIQNQIPPLARLQAFLRRTQRLTIVGVEPTGQINGPLPPGVVASHIDGLSLRARQAVSGFEGRTAFAAVPFAVRTRILAVVVTQGAVGPGPAGLYFLVSAVAALLVGVVVAQSLSRRIIHPLVAMQEAAGRIALGDFAARAPVPAGSYAEVRSLTESVNAMAANLERLRGQERQFLLSVSHDLRTPLTSIRGFAEALADGTTTDTIHAAGVIASEARRLERLVRDLLDLARLDAHRFGFSVRPVDLWEVVSDTADGFAPTAEGLGLSVLVKDPIGDPLPVTADPDRLAQVIANLLENACKFARLEVEVGTRFDGDEAVITVDDDGPGIPPEDLGRVFERLWTNSRGAARQVGSGLGLAIGAELLAAMGGTIHAESPVPGRDAGAGGGARLVVTLRTTASTTA